MSVCFFFIGCKQLFYQKSCSYIKQYDEFFYSDLDLFAALIRSFYNYSCSFITSHNEGGAEIGY